ncbi:MAG: hypothetical protein IJY89_04700 [Clostridia bacterium]|nr:hypothetical protein [Clostridia bacterium]
MAKKGTQKSKGEGRLQKKKKTFLGVTAKEAAIMAALLSVLAVIILASVYLPVIAASSRTNYFFNPWDDRSPFDALWGKNEIFAYSTAMEAIEEQKGMDFSAAPCTYLAVDLTGAEEELQEALKEYFTYWGKKNDKKVVFADKEGLKKQGLMQDDGKNTFTDGYLIEFHENEWNEQRDTLVVHYFFHQADFSGFGYTVTVYKKAGGWVADEDISYLQS